MQVIKILVLRGVTRSLDIQFDQLFDLAGSPFVFFLLTGTPLHTTM